jgi:hypothetical protein
VRTLTAQQIRGVVTGVIRREQIEADPELERFIARLFGIGDLAGVTGATDRVVELAAASSLVCPAHDRRLVPDACRSCAFLAGEVAPAQPAP